MRTCHTAAFSSLPAASASTIHVSGLICAAWQQRGVHVTPEFHRAQAREVRKRIAEVNRSIQPGSGDDAKPKLELDDVGLRTVARLAGYRLRANRVRGNEVDFGDGAGWHPIKYEAESRLIIGLSHAAKSPTGGKWIIRQSRYWKACLDVVCALDATSDSSAGVPTEAEEAEQLIPTLPVGDYRFLDLLRALGLVNNPEQPSRVNGGVKYRIRQALQHYGMACTDPDGCDGNGLYLHVEPSGARHWVQRLVIHGKGCVFGLGSFALVPLAEARQRALANRRVARSGGDPRPAAGRAPGAPTFDEAVPTVLAIHSGAWKSGGRNANSWQATLRDYASPGLARKAVDRVTTADVMAVLLPIWTRKHATAQKVRQRIGTVMKWAIAQGHRSDNPAGDALTAALPKRSAPVRQQRALPHGEVSGAVAAVRASMSWAGLKLVFEFLVLTATRSAEARLATWKEVDLDARVWTVPAALAKAGREHRVPLCSRAIEIVDEARRLGVERTAGAVAGLVFPSQRGKTIADARLSGVLQQSGHRGGAAWFPFVVSGLGIGADGPSAGGDRGGAGPRGAEPDRGRLCAFRPVRGSAAADERLDALPERGAAVADGVVAAETAPSRSTASPPALRQRRPPPKPPSRIEWPCSGPAIDVPGGVFPDNPETPPARTCSTHATRQRRQAPRAVTPAETCVPRQRQERLRCACRVGRTPRDPLGRAASRSRPARHR